MRTPSFSSVSAPPASEDAARLPCLTTGTPQAATTMAAIVDRFTVLAPSPPVPTMSTAFAPICAPWGSPGNVIACDSMVSARSANAHPIRPARGRAGLVSGPSRLNTVGTPISRRTAEA
ncbi:Uncharacterised protein [Mycobacteroides abscessus subsp. abscessus]|nr:Uncharacterised protein [Mycobacteroides abscessus subsp. abscessus]